MSKVWPKLLLLGDSLTQFGFSADGCWVSLVADALQRKCDVVNRGFSGYNTRNFVQVLDQILTPDLAKERGSVVAVVLFLGANDANDPAVQSDCHQHVPLAEYKSNLKKILDQTKTVTGLTNKDFVFIPPPPCDPATWQKFVENRNGTTLSGPIKHQDMDRLYYEACHEVSNLEGITCIPLWDEFLDPKCFIDGLHFSKLGSEKLFQLVWPELEKRTPKEQRLPEWRDFY